MKRPRGIATVAALMILFGLAEVATGFRHRFFGIVTAEWAVFTYSAAFIGALYLGAGVFTLSMKKAGLWAATICMLLDIAGRIALAVTDLYPLRNIEQVLAIVLGTVIAALFTLYIWSQRAVFE